MNKSKSESIEFIEVMVGSLPNQTLEFEIEKWISSNPTWENVEVKVSYNYSGDHRLRGYNTAGDLVIDRVTNLEPVFSLVYKREVAQ